MANLSRLVVLPSNEKAGLGKRLILDRIEKARELGAATCIVTAIGRPLERLLSLGFTIAPNVRGTKVERRIEFFMGVVRPAAHHASPSTASSTRLVMFSRAAATIVPPSRTNQ